MALSSLLAENHIAIDDNWRYWVYITAANEDCSPIKGWVNIDKFENGEPMQQHVLRKSPWSWHGFDTLEEQAKPADQLDKTNRNKSMILDFADYTESMTRIHDILQKLVIRHQIDPTATIEIFKESTNGIKLQLEPEKIKALQFDILFPLTVTHLKAGLRADWTAEQIGRLAVKYESEWYADESLSKWNEIDDFYEKELEKKNITKPVEREHVLKALTEMFKFHLNEWQIEKVQRIKPSLWWSGVKWR